jgi:uncharacterized membrane protein
MTTEPTTPITMPSTLLEELVERSRLSWLQVTIVVELALILCLIGAALLSGVLARPVDANFWRANLVWPAVIAYSLLMSPFSRRVRNGAIKAFRPLVPLDNDKFNRLLAEASVFNRRREWLALLIGSGSVLLVSGATIDWASVEPSSWPLLLYGLLGAGLTCGMIGFVVYSSMAGTKLFTELSRYPLNVSVYDLAALEPIARWSLASTLGYIGGITLSLLFLPREAFRAIGMMIIIYTPLTLAAVLVFFLNMSTVHGDMVEAKQRELATVRDNRMALSKALEERTARGEIENPQALLDAIKAWTAHEEWIRGLPEWPYTAGIKRNLILSLLLPGVVGIIREALSGFLRQLLPLP